MKYKKFNITGLISVSLLTLFIAGCSTVNDSKKQTLTFQSTPTGATVAINGSPVGVTPITTLIEMKPAQSITVSKEGYKTFSTSMNTTLDTWLMGKILNGGVLGSPTKGSSGAMQQFAPYQFLISLVPEGAPN